MTIKTFKHTEKVSQSLIKTNSKKSKAKAKTNSFKPRGQDLSVAIGLLIVGIMFFYFPNYASISTPWSWIFYMMAYVLYFLSLVGTVTGLSKLVKNSEFVKFTGIAFIFGAITFLLHKWSQSSNMFSWFTLLLKLLALSSAIFTTLAISVGLPFIWDVNPETEQKRNLNDRDSEKETPRKSRFEQIVSVVIAVITLLTALVPLLKVWLNLP